jgi:hypothetical protein
MFEVNAMKKYPSPLITVVLTGILLSMGLCAAPAVAGSGVELSSGQTVYVAVYSHIYSGNREHPLYLAATLSVRNTSFDHPISILTVDYYDSSGKLLKKYLKGPVELEPMGTVRYVIPEADKKGGSGANFIVRWESKHKISQPLIESVMIGTKSQQGISFTSRGQVIQELSR